jgi:hypothetical protein
MERLRTFVIVLVTPIVTCALTSAFWFIAYSGVRVVGPGAGGPAGPPPPAVPQRPAVILGPTGDAAAPGTVEKLFFSQGGGGITAYVRSTDGHWIYYYAHLQDYAPGLHEGQKVAQGDPIGRVGSTGNANPAGPHLHFAIHRMAEGEKWHEGTAINPYPLLAGER